MKRTRTEIRRRNDTRASQGPVLALDDVSPPAKRPKDIFHVAEQPLALFRRAGFVHAPPFRELSDILVAKEGGEGQEKRRPVGRSQRGNAKSPIAHKSTPQRQRTVVSTGLFGKASRQNSV